MDIYTQGWKTILKNSGFILGEGGLKSQFYGIMLNPNLGVGIMLNQDFGVGPISHTIMKCY